MRTQYTNIQDCRVAYTTTYHERNRIETLFESEKEPATQRELSHLRTLLQKREMQLLNNLNRIREREAVKALKNAPNPYIHITKAK